MGVARIFEVVKQAPLAAELCFVRLYLFGAAARKDLFQIANFWVHAEGEAGTGYPRILIC